MPGKLQGYTYNTWNMLCRAQHKTPEGAYDSARGPEKTKKTHRLTEWWGDLNSELVRESEPEAGFKEAREQYETGNTPSYAALAIKADRAFAAQQRALNWKPQP